MSSLSFFLDQEAEERQEALDAEKAQKEQLRLQEVSRVEDPCAVRGIHE